MDARGIGVGILVGLVAGLALGMLYAPQPGRETREHIGEKLHEFREKASEVAGKLTHHTSQGQ
jgi:gas vesicle protein